MKRCILLVLLILIFTTACGHSDSSPLPTQPAANFPTLAPDTLPLCQLTDLDTSSNADNAPNKVVMGMTLTNKSQHICILSNPPKASLLDKNKKPLELQTLNLSAALNPQAPALLQLTPGGIVIFTLAWQNYCQPAAMQELTLRLVLSNGQNLDDILNISATPACTDKNKPSTIAIGPFSAPP